MFDSIRLKKNGSEIKKLASRKNQLLQTIRGRLEEAIEDLNKTPFLSAEQRKISVGINQEKIEEINDSIIFCEVLVENLPDAETFELTVMEVNFLVNESVLTYR